MLSTSCPCKLKLKHVVHLHFSIEDILKSHRSQSSDAQNNNYSIQPLWFQSPGVVLSHCRDSLEQRRDRISVSTTSAVLKAFNITRIISINPYVSIDWITDEMFLTSCDETPAWCLSNQARQTLQKIWWQYILNCVWTLSALHHKLAFKIIRDSILFFNTAIHSGCHVGAAVDCICVIFPSVHTSLESVFKKKYPRK